MKLSETRYMQFIATIAASLSGPAVTSHMTWASPALPLLQSDDSPLGRPATDEEGSWLVSILFLLTVPGGIVGGYISQKFGRKISLLLGGIISLISWIMLTFAGNVIIMFIARSLAGISFGIIAAVTYMYIGEVADDDIRGTLAMVNSLFSPIGALLILAAGPYMSYRPLCFLCGSLCLPFLIMFMWMPETPLFYITNGQTDAAKNSLTILLTKNTKENDINKRIMILQEQISANKSTRKINAVQLFTNWKYLKPFCLVIGMFMFYLLSGIPALESYMQTIISSSNSSLSPELSSIIFGIVKVPPVFLAIVLCDRVGRRPLYAISALGCFLALFSLGVYFYIQDFQEDYVDSISWLPTTALSAFMIINPIGFTSVPYVLQSELFPSESKEMSCSLLYVFVGLTAFGIAKAFSPLLNALGRYTMFWFFSGVCLLGVVYMYTLIPETKGKSFTDIQDEIFNKKNNLETSKSSA